MKNDNKRAARRAYYAKIQRAARLKAEREFAEDAYRVARGSMRPYAFLRRYIRRVRSDGHWLNGGCSRARCGLCQPRERVFRDQRELARMDEELINWFADGE